MANLVHSQWDIGGFYGKLVTNVFVMPVFFVLACGLLYMNQRRTIAAVIAAGGSDSSSYITATVGFKSNLLFGVFLLYPTITTTLFRVPQCLELADEHAFHEEDFSIDCNSGRYMLTLAFSFAAIILVPIGVPAVFLYFMKQAKDALGGVNETALGGAKLVADDVSDEDDPFGYLCKDCKPEFYYYEIVSYARKLILGGISIFMGRGSLAQVYFVVAFESWFLMHHMRSYPYSVQKHNQIDALGHCILILTYTVTFILRQSDEDLEDEVFPREGYGLFIVFMYIVVLPAPTIYYFFKDSSGNDAEGSGATDERSFDNPLQDDMGTFGDDAELAPSNKKGQSRTASTARLSKLQRENDSLKAENKRQGEVIAGMGASAAGAEMMAAAKAQADAAAEAKVQANIELHRWDTRRPSQVLAIQGLVQEGMLTEESITEAKKTLALQFELQGKQQRRQQQLQGQQNAFETEAKRDVCQKEMIEAQMNQMRQRTPVAFAARSSLSDWLDKHRLTRHELQIIAMAGPETALGDLMLLDEEDVAELCSAMTKVEARRFEAALKANADDKPDSADDDAEDQVSAIAEGSSQKKLSSSKKSTMTSSQL